MDTIFGVLSAALVGVIGGFVSEKLTRRLRIPNLRRSTTEQMTTISNVSEETIQRCLYHRNKGRSIEAVHRTVSNEEIRPEFVLVCPLTKET